jgi:hypothetical protein
MKYIGLDVGYGYTKATDGSKTIVFPSVVSPPVEMRFDPLLDHASESLNQLSVTFEGKHYFLGEMALRQGRFAHATLDRIAIVEWLYSIPKGIRADRVKAILFQEARPGVSTPQDNQAAAKAGKVAKDLFRSILKTQERS